MKISLFTPEQTLLKIQPVKEVLVPSVQGFLGILPGHAPLISLLRAGVLEYLLEGEELWEKVALGWGYLEVRQDKITILAESAETKKTLDRAQAKKNLEEVLKKLHRWDIEPSEREKWDRERFEAGRYFKSLKAIRFYSSNLSFYPRIKR